MATARADQVSVFVENRPGRLVALLEILDRAGINIKGMSVSDAAEIGIVRFMLTAPARALEEFKRAGFTARLDTVLTVDVPDVPGGLLKAMASPLARANVNLQYLYAYTDPTTKTVVAVLKTDNIDGAERALSH